MTKYVYTVVPHTLNFHRPAGTSRGIYVERRIWYIYLSPADNNKIVGIGECAPLLALSCDDLPNYETILRQLLDRFVESGEIIESDWRPYPSMLMGLETALLSCEAQQKGRSALQLFDTPFSRGEVGIPTNGLVWMGTQSEMQQRIEEKIAQGSRCIKLKVGAVDFEEELSLVRDLRTRYRKEELEIRLDANGAFSASEALRKLERLAVYDIHSIEQPIRAGQWQQMKTLCTLSPIPIALDEELIGVNFLREKKELLDTISPHYIILKPSLHGGLKGAEEWMAEACQRNIDFWVTSALESNIGLNAIAQWISNAGTAYYPTSPMQWPYQGLGTGTLFANNYRGTRLSVEGNNLWIEDKQQRDFRKALKSFQEEWRNSATTMTVKTSGSTGTPQHLQVKKQHMRASAEKTCTFFQLTKEDTALLCLPLDFVAGKMMVVRSEVVGFPLEIAYPTTHPLAHVVTSPTFVAMTPMQAFETLSNEAETEVLKGVRHLLIGGGTIMPALEEKLQTFIATLPADNSFHAWSSYGMTETLSHVALRRLCSSDAPQGYVPLDGVEVKIAPDGRISIFAPHVSEIELRTNDIGEWLEDGSFKVIGRVDNVVCSGGLKLQIEELEKRLSHLDVSFALTAIPDERLGEALTLVYEGQGLDNMLLTRCAECLLPNERPRHIVAVSALPLTETGKIARKQLQQTVCCLLGK